jgi:hypothetical protein
MCLLAETIITRECLSSLRGVRTDIPADHYEGCRPAAKDVRLAHYVNNSIKELDIKRYVSSLPLFRWYNLHIQLILHYFSVMTLKY